MWLAICIREALSLLVAHSHVFMRLNLHVVNMRSRTTVVEGNHGIGGKGRLSASRLAASESLL